MSGGTGLYLRAALADLDVPPPPRAGVRERILSEVEADPAAAHERLVAPRPALLRRPFTSTTTRRLVRALELAEIGQSLVPDDDRLWATRPRHPTLIVGLDVPADELERRIVARTDAMFEQGVVDEVRAALAAGVSPHRGEGARADRDRDAARSGGARADHRPHAPVRRVPAEVDAPDPRPR